MGEMVEFARADGQSCPAYVARPPDRDDAPAVVVIQEWWGLNEQMKSVADRLAEKGYRALVPDLYRGKLAKDADEANHMMSKLDWGSAAGQDLPGAVSYLKGSGSERVAVLGFCMGGALTLIAAANVAKLDAAVCFYGIPPAEAADPAAIQIPLLCHFASQDDWCTPEAVDALEQRLQAGNVNYELFRYDAQHAFFNEQRPEVYNTIAAEAAWDRSIDFLGRNLG